MTSHARAGELIYAMRVNEIIPYQQYFSDERFAYKKPTGRTAVQRRGDNLWYRDSSGRWQCISPALHDMNHRDHDIKGENVLVSTEFYYFGRKAVKIPKRFEALVAVTQGHRKSDDERLVSAFWKWIQSRAPKKGRIGDPWDFTEEGCTVQRAMHEDEDQPENPTAVANS